MSEYPLEPECLALDPGAGSLRFAYVDNRGCPEPSIVTNIMKDRHYNTMVAMKSSPSFHKKAYYSDARLIVADAFRAKSNYIKGVSFYIQRENDSYKIPSLERQMVEHEKSLLEQEYETISQVKIMSMMLKDISDIIDDRLKRKGIYVCVPDASDIHHRRKLRKALELASIRRQREDDNNVEETASPRSIPEEIDPILFIQQSAAVAQMAFYWIHGNVSDVFRAKKARYIETEIYPRKVVVAITFGAGHFSAGVYEQRSFERYGIIRLFESSDDQLGGEDLNLKLGEWCMKHKDIQPYADELKKSKRLLKFYRDTLEVVKTDLSELDSIATDVEVGEDSIVNVEISQEEFNSVCAGIFKRVEDHLKEVSKYLGEYNITCANIICAGGSTRNPEFEKIIKRVFPNSRIIESINLDECQVLGTGLKAGIRDGIHRLAYAECQDTAMDDCYVTINGVKLYLTKKGESVQNAPERWIKKKKRSNRIPYPDDDNNNLEVETNELKWTPNVESDVHLMIQDYSKIICDKKSTENKEKTNARISTGPQEDTNIHLDTKVNTQDYSTKEIYRQGPHQEPRQSYQIEKDSGTQHQTSSLLSLIYPLHQPETIVLGIDLGTTKIVCATYKIGSSKSEVLTFNDEGKTLPSFVGFDKDGYRSFYGKQALKNLKANPGYVLYDAKRMIGQAYSDRIKLHTPYWAFDVKHNKDNRPVYVLPSGREILPEKVVMTLLKVIKEEAENALGRHNEIKDCVITVPAYFGMAQKQATIDAAQQAGLNVLSLMTEPMAAVYAHYFDHSKHDEFTFFVFDLGGGTFDVSIIKCKNGQFVMKCTDGDSNLGGRDFDNALFEHLKQNILNVNFDDSTSFRQRAQLMEKCEEIKIQLSQLKNILLKLDDFGGKGNIYITQELFEYLTQGLSNKITYICERVLKNAGIDVSKIDKVLVMGNASRMRTIQNLLRELFSKKVNEENKLNIDEAIAIGAAIRAAQMKDSEQRKKNNVIEVLPIGIGLTDQSTKYSIIVKRGTVFPNIIRKKYFVNNTDRRPLSVVIYEGERVQAKKNMKLGEVDTQKFYTPFTEVIPVDVSFNFDQNGILTVYTESQDGRKMSFTIDYKAIREEKETIEDLIRQLENSRKGDQGKRITDSAKKKLLENIEQIRFRATTSDFDSTKKLKYKCVNAENSLRKQNTPFGISKYIRDLEDEVKGTLINH